MSDLRELYQEVIVDHSKRPRNFGPLEGANYTAEGYNPLCGDRFSVHLIVRAGRVEDARFEGSGCAISTASASLMTEGIKGKPIEDAEKLFGGVHGLVTGEPAEPPQVDLGKLKILRGVRDFPTRVKCATLAWHTMRAALHGEEQVSTE